MKRTRGSTLVLADGTGALLEALEVFRGQDNSEISASRKELEAVKRRTRERSLDGQFEKLVNVSRVDLSSESEAFLMAIQAESTRKAYRAALNRFFSWCVKEQVHPLQVSPGAADSFILSLTLENYAPSSVNQSTSGVSSWFVWLGGRYEWVGNPFEKSRQRPKIVFPEVRVPTEGEVSILLKRAKPRLAAALAVMAYNGLRSDSLRTLEIHDRRYTAVSKQKRISGDFSPIAAHWIAAAGLDLSFPFRDREVSDSYWSRMVFALSERLVKDRELSHHFTAHDLRHFFACREYELDHDMERVCDLLGHRSIVTTDRYLRGLGVRK